MRIVQAAGLSDRGADKLEELLEEILLKGLLEETQDALNRGKDKEASDDLRAFIDIVSDWPKTEGIPAGTAAILISYAQEFMNSLGG